MAGKSTSHAITYMLHLALEALDSGDCWIRLFFADFRKGFDLIDHTILVDKLSSFNIHPCLVRWIASFLLERSQRVSIAGYCSPPLHLKGGIPQGTKLGPLLFAVMVNDLVSTWGPRAKYVDDLTILEIIPRNCPSYLGYIVNDTELFAFHNNMCLNPTKCKTMRIDFLHYNSYTCPSLATGGAFIECVKSFKFLGVYVSHDLTWRDHCDYIIKKSNRRLYALRILKKCGVDVADIVVVYCSLVRPILEYASVCFANLPKYLSLDLERVQKRALAIIFPDLSYKNALEVANLQLLDDRRSSACQDFIASLQPSNPLYNIVKGQLRSATHRYNFRNSNNIHLKPTRTDRFKHFVTHKYAKLISSE